MQSEAIATSGCDVEQIVNVDIGGRGAIGALHSAASEAYSRNGEALPVLAAKGLISSLEAGDVALLLTGFPEMPWIGRGVGETDGPVGAAVLARALIRGLHVIPVVPIEDHFAPLVRAACLGLGITVLQGDVSAVEHLHPGDPVLVLSRVHEDTELATLFDSLAPRAVIAIERPGANEAGQFHHMSGRNISHCLDDVEGLFNLANERGVFTLAIGDGGNEVGMGRLKETVRRMVVRGDECGCGCGGGIASVSSAAALVTAAVANWGATATASAMACLLGRRDVLASPGLELRSLDACAAAGAVDGANSLSLPTVDGVPRDIYRSVISVVSHLTDRALEVAQ